MFCKKCGAQIDNDSEFCKSCGAKQNNEPIKKFCPKCGVPITNQIKCDNCNHILNNKRKTNLKTKKQKRKENIIVAIILIIAFGAMITPALIEEHIKNTNKENESSSQSQSESESQEKENVFPQILKRDATTNDIECTESLDISNLSIVVYITPKCDIEDLEIKIKFYDKNNELLKTITKTIGDVEEGEEIKKTIPLTDIPNIFKTETAKLTVSDGKVSYIQ